MGKRSMRTDAGLLARAGVLVTGTVHAQADARRSLASGGRGEPMAVLRSGVPF